MVKVALAQGRSRQAQPLEALTTGLNLRRYRRKERGRVGPSFIKRARFDEPDYQRRYLKQKRALQAKMRPNYQQKTAAPLALTNRVDTP